MHSRSWERYAWAAGIAFVLALVAESIVSVGVAAKQDDSAAKIASQLHDHHTRLIAIACLSIVYAPMFVVYLTRLHDLLRGEAKAPRFLSSSLLIGGVLFVTLHGVSDIGITGLLGAKLAAFGAQHDHGLSYTLYLLTYALDSVGDVFGSLFALAAGALVLASGALPRWLGWLAIVAAPLLFVQGFGLGGVIAEFGLVVDLFAFLFLLIFVLASSAILLVRDRPVATAALSAT